MERNLTRGQNPVKLLLFEDTFRTSFLPVCHTRIVGDLRCGALKLRQRLEHIFGDDEAIYLIDPALEELYKERHADWEINQIPAGDKLYLNFRLKLTSSLEKQIKELAPEQALVKGEELVAIRSSREIQVMTTKASAMPPDILKIPTEAELYSLISDLIHDNKRMLEYDFDLIFSDMDNHYETEPGVTILNPYRVWLGEAVELKPGVIIDASDGPVIIDEGAKIMHHSVIIGPAYIGKNSVVKIGAKIYEGCSIGPVCKVGGELEDSIIQAYSNKQHDGFLGHSYLGEWVNIGADTNNSDLKNTYRNVAIYSYQTKGKVDSGTQFMGAIIGDHSKLGINSTINTGAVIGVACNLWGLGLIDGFIADFSWGSASTLSEYRIADFLKTASLVKERRKLKLGAAEAKLYERLAKQNLEY